MKRGRVARVAQAMLQLPSTRPPHMWHMILSKSEILIVQGRAAGTCPALGKSAPVVPALWRGADHLSFLLCWLARTSHRPISRTVWLKVSPLNL
eukprot:scaffold188877_cov17-Tisochrysis_lutea.AAC.1